MAACDFDESKNNFQGGELLDKEVMESIKNSLNSSDTTDAVTTEKSTDVSTEQESERETGSCTDSEDDEELVYWLQSGSYWHSDPNCRYIKGKEVVSGTVNEAIEQGKKRLCKSCDK